MQEIEDPDALVALEMYIDFLNSKIDKKANNSFVIHVAGNEKGKTVYVSTAQFLSEFCYNVPNSFSTINDRTVFVYKKEKRPDNNDGFIQFKNQFRDHLIIDCSENCIIDSEVKMKYLDLTRIGTYRFKFNDGIITDIDKVERFPDRQFFSQNLAYDAAGYLKYNDDSYHFKSLDNNLSNDFIFELEKHLIDSNVLTTDQISNNYIFVTLTISDRGKVEKVQIDVEEGYLSKEDRLNIEKALMSVNEFKPRTVRGEPVYYKLVFKLS